LLFETLLQSGGWNVVIPHGAITYLLLLSRQTGPDSAHAQDALQTVRKAILENKNVRIATEKGNDVTDLFISEKMGSDDPEDLRRSEDSIISIVRRESDLNRQFSGKQMGNHSEARPAVLVTEDKAMRIKAATAGVAAIATSMIKKVLIAPRKKLEPETQSQ